MALIRSALHMLWMALTVIPWATAALLLSLVLGSTRLYWFCVGWLRLAVGGAGPLLGIRNRVTGFHHLPADPHAPAVLLVKHQSTWETFSIPTLMPRPLAYVFKRELLRIPFFGWAMARLDMVHIDRDQRAAAFAKVVQQGQRLLNKGVWVIMFPEGTRMARGEKGVYRLSGTRLAIECGAPVIPIAVTSARCWPPRAFVKRPGVVDISIGPPIPSTGRRADELMREVEQWIESEMLRLDPDAYPDGQARLNRRPPGRE
ncbi:MAG: lysophospholipid acyltransferase family protein [Pseudomonadota bacterium]|nr:lysophospholipid acyltransferase family protein [Pseudomonadota bacterium]